MEGCKIQQPRCDMMTPVKMKKKIVYNEKKIKKKNLICLFFSTPSMSNLSMSSNNSKWEPDATPLSSKYCRVTPSSRKKNSKKVDHLKKLFANQKMEAEDSLIDFLQSVT